MIKFLVAGFIGNFFQPILTYALNGKLFIFPSGFILLACSFAAISGLLLAGLLGYSISELLFTIDAQVFPRKQITIIHEV
ncbi:hypothetical protein GF325_10205 [Candidatus Bathyarchaeota archaeon]|nr:hypothetical protein [Candidatus Bathyarchaeota archaeon]